MSSTTHPARTDEVQLPPYSPEAEMGVLGCILLSPNDALGQCIQAFKAGGEVFYDLRHRTIYELLVAMHNRKEAIDLVTVQQRLKDRNQLDAIGGLAYLSALPDAVPSAANLSYYADIIREKWDLRQIIRTATEILQTVGEHPERAADIAQHGAKALGSVGADRNGSFTIRKPDELLGMTFSDADNLLGDRLWATGQPLVIAGASAIGKSRLLLQLAIASIAGRDFLGLATRGESRRWLILQAENTNRRLKADLERLRAWIGPGDWPRVNERLSIHTLESDADGFVALDDPGTVSRLARLIADLSPDCVGFDSLYNFAIGDLNKDEDMRATLTAISRLVKTGNPERAPVVLHHAITGRAGASKATGFERASFGRNSKVLHAWARGQVNVAPGSADSNEVLVLACGKCSNGREFEPFAVRLNPQTLIYEPEPGFDFRAWQGEVTGRTDHEPLTTPERVRELCRPAMTRADLAKAIQQDSGCARQVSYRYILRAEKARSIRFNKAHEHFSPA